MVRRAPAAVALAFLCAACSARRSAPAPVAHAPIGVERQGPVPVEDPASDAGVEPPDEACALPLACDASGAGTFFSIALERTPCSGRCPAYRVMIDARGEISWHGRDFVETPGSFTVPGDARKARELIELVLSSCFLEMQDEYASVLTGSAWANTTVTVGNTTTTIRHHLGDKASGSAAPGKCGAPAALFAIEKKIDEVADTARWVGRDAGL